MPRKVAKIASCSVYSEVSDKIPPTPELYCVEIQRHKGDLGLSVILPATCELKARWEFLRLFPEYRHRAVHVEVYLIRYAEIDWASGRSLVIKRNKRREIPAVVAQISKSFIENPPRLKREGDLKGEGDAE